MKQATITQVNAMLEKCRKYFKSKLLKGEFDIVYQGMHTIHLNVEGHVFIIWTGIIYSGSVSTNRVQYGKQDVGYSEPIDLKITPQESIILDKILRPIIEKYIKDVEIKTLEEKLNLLKNR